MGDQPRTSKKGIRRYFVLFAASLSMCIYGGTYRGIGVFLVEWRWYFDASSARISAIISVMAGSVLVSGFLGGPLMARYGCHNVLIIGGTLIICGSVFTIFAHTPEIMFFTLGVFWGLGTGLSKNAAQVIIAFHFKKGYIRANGVVSAGVGIGVMVFPPLMQFLIDCYGWRGTLLILAAIQGNLIVAGVLSTPPKRLKSSISSTRTSKPVSSSAISLHERTSLDMTSQQGTNLIAISARDGTTLESSKINFLQGDEVMGSSSPEQSLDKPQKILPEMVPLTTSCMEINDDDELVNTGDGLQENPLVPDDTKHFPNGTMSDDEKASYDSCEASSLLPEEKCNVKLYDPLSPVGMKGSAETDGLLSRHAGDKFPRSQSCEDYSLNHEKQYKSEESLSRTDTKIMVDILDPVPPELQSCSQRELSTGSRALTGKENQSAVSVSSKPSRLQRLLKSMGFLLFRESVGFSLFQICLLATGMNYVAIMAHFIASAVYAGVDRQSASFLITIMGMVSTPVRLTNGWFVHLHVMKVEHIYILSMMLFGGATILSRVWTVYGWFVFIAVLLGIGVGTFKPLFPVINKKFVGVENLGAAMGMGTVTGSIGELLGPILAGALYDAGNSYDVPFYVCGTIFMITSLLLLLEPPLSRWKERRKGHNIDHEPMQKMEPL